MDATNTKPVEMPLKINLPKIEIGRNLVAFLKETHKRLDDFIEYPGSIKETEDGNGWWRFQEWAEYRIDQSLKNRGERV